MGLHRPGPGETGCLKGETGCLKGIWEVCGGFEHKGKCSSLCWSLEPGSPVSGCCLCPLEAVQGAGAHARHVATLRRRGELKDSEKGSILPPTSAHPGLGEAGDQETGRC